MMHMYDVDHAFKFAVHRLVPHCTHAMIWISALASKGARSSGSMSPKILIDKTAMQRITSNQSQL